MRSTGGASAPAAGRILPSFQEHTARAGNAYSFVEGRAGAAVTAAALVLSDGSKVQATIQNGWLVAWWPGSAQLVSGQVTTATGTSTQAFDTAAMSQCPSPPAGTTTPTDAMCAGGLVGKGQGQAMGSISIQSSDSGRAPASGSAPGTGTGG
jgi:hypothetical protein